MSYRSAPSSGDAALEVAPHRRGLPRRCWLALILSFCTGALAAVEPPEFSPADLEQRALDYRRHMIRSADIILQMEKETRTGSGEFREHRFEHHTRLEGSRIRRAVRGHGSRTWGNWSETVLSGADYISWPGPQYGVLVAPQDEYDDAQDHLNVYDPRALGLNLGGLVDLDRDGIGSVLNRRSHRPVGVEAVRVDGADLLRIDYETAGEGHLSVWVAPSQGYGVVRMEHAFTFADGEREPGLRRMIADLERMEGDVWYPRSVTTEFLIDGERISREVVTVSEARFNIDLPESTFTLAGLNLPVGHEILDRSKGSARVLRWDGEQVVGISAEEVRRDEAAAKTLGTIDKPQRETFKAGWRQWLLYANAAVLGIAVVVLMWRGLRKRRFG